MWIAKKLRRLWRAGCDVAIIYSVSSRPVLSILRSGSGRGPVPMKQSVVKDSWGNIVKYNHSKWMTISGRWGGSAGAYETFSGSANWANLAFGDDEQMQRISSRRRRCATTRSSPRPGARSPPKPSYGSAGGRVRARIPAPELGPDVPARRARLRQGRLPLHDPATDRGSARESHSLSTHSRACYFRLSPGLIPVRSRLR